MHLAAPVEVEPVAPKAPSRESEVAPLSGEVVGMIHDAMRHLAAMCDVAQALDGHGFNKLDAAFDHDIAARASLTQRQARAAAKLVIKYGRQLDADLVEAVKREVRQ
jgi:hypothetical protein